MMAKRRARWKRLDRWRLKTAFDIPALLISLILWHTVVKAFPNCYSCSHLTVSLLSHQEAACSSPKRAASVKSKTIFSRDSSFVVFRDRLSASPLLAWRVSWKTKTCWSSDLPRLLTSSHHGPPDASQQKAGGCSCAPSQHHILDNLGFAPILRNWISSKLDSDLVPLWSISWSYYTHTYYTTCKQVTSTRSSFRDGSFLNLWKTFDWVYSQICIPSPALTRQYFP